MYCIQCIFVSRCSDTQVHYTTLTSPLFNGFFLIQRAMRPRYGCLCMDQNIIGLVLKTSGYPDQVAVSDCHGTQVNFKISKSKKFLISP